MGTTVYHFSIQSDLSELLNFNHEYQISWIKPSDGTWIRHLNWCVRRLCSGLTVTFESMPCLLAGSLYRPLSTSGAHNLKVHDHVGNDFFATPLIPFTWHDFAVQVDDSTGTILPWACSIPRTTLNYGRRRRAPKPHCPAWLFRSMGFSKAPGVLSCIQYEKLLLVYLSDARQVE